LDVLSHPRGKTKKYKEPPYWKYDDRTIKIYDPTGKTLPFDPPQWD